MKRFDEDSIKSRCLDRMKQNSKFASIVDDGALSNIFDAFAAGISEVARYNEYSFLETKWDTAQNITSLTAMAELIGRKRQRAKSSLGYIVVSHTDENGNNRLANLGTSFFDIDEESNYDDLVEDTSANYIKKSALVPWTSSKSYTIPKGTQFFSADGIPFISTKSVRIKPLTHPYSTIKNEATMNNEFLKAGGWNSIKYLKIPVIQGIEKDVVVGTTTGGRFESFKLNITDIENASNITSKDYFYLTVTPPDGTSSKWFEIRNIRLAGNADEVFEILMLKDGSGVQIKLGDGISGAIPPVGSVLTLHYLETMGASGNVTAKYQIKDMVLPSGQLQVDPRNNSVSEFLSCVNVSPISGGKDIENEDEFKVNAPSSYLSSYTVATIDSYINKIMDNSSIALSKLKCYTDSNYVLSATDTSHTTLASEVNIASSSINITALKANNTPLDSIEAENFIDELRLILNDIKGPNDSFRYVAPNIVDIEPSIKIKTSDVTVVDADAIDKIKKIIFSEYSMYNSDFGKPLYLSRLSYLTQLYKFVDSVDISLNAKATINIPSTADSAFTTIEYGNTSPITYARVPFKFDTLFAKNSQKAGFKNTRDEAIFTLKVDIVNNYNSALSRTLFLIDNRSTEETDITDAKSLNTNGTVATSIATGNYGNKTVKLFNEYTNSYKNRQVRVAQFPLLQGVVDSEYVANLLNHRNSIFEYRPLVTDNNGDNKTFSSSEVESSLRNSTNVDGGKTPAASDDSECYKLNTSYIENFEIVYSEEYTNPKSADYASGALLIPISYFSSDRELAYAILKNYLTINIYAEPRLSDIETDDVNDLIYIKDMNVEITKEYKN